MLGLHPRVLASLYLPFLLSTGCDQFRSLKASNSEEGFGRNQPDDDWPVDEGGYTPSPSYPSGDGDGDGVWPPTFPWPTTECTATQQLCDGYCADVSSARYHCGGCNQSCGDFQECVAGTCQCYGTGQILCGGECVAPTQGPCGPCGDACPVDSGECEDTDSHVADWPMLGGNNLRSGYNAGELGVPPLSDEWAISVFPAPLNPVMISGSKIYVSVRSNFEKRAPLFALDVATGTPLWEKDFGDANSVGQPTVVGCRVYVQHGNGAAVASQLWSLDSQSGAEIWARRFPSQRNSFWSPAVTNDAIYFAAGTYGGLFGYARSDASSLFEVTTMMNFESWAPVVYDGDVYTFMDGKLRRHDANTGATKDTISVTWRWSATTVNTLPTFSPDGTVYLVAPPSVYAFEVQTKKLKWQSGTAASGTPALAEGSVLALDGKKLAAFDAQTGEKAWTATESDDVLYGPVAANGFAYVASEANTYAVDLKTGTVVWQKAGGGFLSIGSGRLFVSGSEGLLRSYRLTAPESLAP